MFLEEILQCQLPPDIEGFCPMVLSKAFVVATACQRILSSLMKKAVIKDSPLLVIPPKTIAMTGQVTRAAA